MRTGRGECLAPLPRFRRLVAGIHPLLPCRGVVESVTFGVSQICVQIPAGPSLLVVFSVLMGGGGGDAWEAWAQLPALRPAHPQLPLRSPHPRFPLRGTLQGA